MDLAEQKKILSLKAALDKIQVQTEALSRAFHLATAFIFDQPCECWSDGMCGRCKIILDINSVLEESHGTN